jgi:hypothetical protein
MIQADLPPTLTHPSRKVLLFTDGCVSRIVIATVDATAAKRIELDAFDVEEHPTIHAGCRCWNLYRVTDDKPEPVSDYFTPPDDNLTYRVATGGTPDCDCSAGRLGRRKSVDRCRHYWAIEMLLRAGAFPVRAEVAPARNYEFEPDEIPF